MARRGTSRTRAPDIYEARSLPGWLSALLDQRLAREPGATSSTLADAAGIPVGPDADLGTLLLVDDLLCLGTRGLERHPELGSYAFAHQALPQRALPAQRARVEDIHRLVRATGPETRATGALAMLMTHSTPASHPVPPQNLASERP